MIDYSVLINKKECKVDLGMIYLSLKTAMCGYGAVYNECQYSFELCIA